MLRAPLLLAAVLVVCTASSADARGRHHGYYGERYSTPSDTDDSRRGREAQDFQGRDRGEHRSRGRDYRRGARSLDEWRRNREVQDLQGQENKQDPQGQESKQGHPQDRAQDAGQNPGPDPARATDDWRRGRDRDEWRRARYRDDGPRGRYRDDWTRRRAAERGAVALRPGRGGPFGAVVEKLIRGCAAQGAEFEHWPFDAIAKIAGADDTQRKALEGLRGAAKQAAERLSADCPQDIPAAPSARLEAVEQGIDAALKAFDTVQPALATFYGALDDEQKARLYRDMAASAAAHAPQTSGRRERRDYRRDENRRDAYSSRRDRWRPSAAARAGAPRQAAGPGWGATCEPLAAVLRNWPVREIERDVRLDGPQRVAFYELVTASLKAADTLGSACPAETALTPVGRMETMRKRLAAVRAATAAIRPALMRFYEALDQGQKVRFAGMS
jgi:hypothetical protein